jgi:hypothetical protein
MRRGRCRSLPVGRGPTGRGITGDIVTFSHPDDAPVARGKPKGKLSRDGTTLIPSSLDGAFVLDGPGEYEVKEVLVTGVRTYRDDAKAPSTARACRSSSKSMASIRSTSARSAPAVRGEARRHRRDRHRLRADRGRAEPHQGRVLMAQLDPKIVVPMTLCEDDRDCAEALAKFFHEMGAEPVTQPNCPSRPRACRPRRSRCSWSRAASRPEPALSRARQGDPTPPDPRLMTVRTRSAPG